jgi:hypothetical protein
MRRPIPVTFAAAMAVLVGLAGAASAGPREGAGAGCEVNTHPTSVVLCDGAGELALTLNGAARGAMDEGWFAIRVDSAPARRRPIPGLSLATAETRTFRDGEYRVFAAPVFATLPKGRWVVRMLGAGINVAAIGRGNGGLSGEEAGLISVNGAEYRSWPSGWERFRFGPGATLGVKLGTDRPKFRP